MDWRTVLSSSSRDRRKKFHNDKIIIIRDLIFNDDKLARPVGEVEVSSLAVGRIKDRLRQRHE